MAAAAVAAAVTVPREHPRDDVDARDGGGTHWPLCTCSARAALAVRQLDLSGRAGRGRLALAVVHVLARAALAVRQLDLPGGHGLQPGGRERGRAALTVVHVLARAALAVRQLDRVRGQGTGWHAAVAISTRAGSTGRSAAGSCRAGTGRTRRRDRARAGSTSRSAAGSCRAGTVAPAVTIVARRGQQWPFGRRIVSGGQRSRTGPAARSDARSTRRSAAGSG